MEVGARRSPAAGRGFPARPPTRTSRPRPPRGAPSRPLPGSPAAWGARPAAPARAPGPPARAARPPSPGSGAAARAHARLGRALRQPPTAPSSPPTWAGGGAGLGGPRRGGPERFRCQGRVPSHPRGTAPGGFSPGPLAFLLLVFHSRKSIPQVCLCTFSGMRKATALSSYPAFPALA